ncbi:S-adenosyl-L-methionine-dependent methyltransferase, partial [Crucibulum laeve]
MSITVPAASLDHREDRNFTSFPNSSYIFPSDDREKERLRNQHFFWRRVFGGRILFAPIMLQPTDVVLESGAGSGIWLLDIAKEVPASVTLHGIDIESNLFPELHPENIHFSISSVTTLPHEWTNKFTLVHQRLLIGALKKSEWPTALQEIHRVLAPGGWVQLFESAGREAGPCLARMRAMASALYASRGQVGDIISRHLPLILPELGFINVTTEEREQPSGTWAGKEGIEGKKNIIDLYIAMKPAILKAGGFGIINSEQGYDDLLEALGKELDETMGAFQRACVVYAQKPVAVK